MRRRNGECAMKTIDGATLKQAVSWGLCALVFCRLPMPAAAQKLRGPRPGVSPLASPAAFPRGTARSASFRFPGPMPGRTPAGIAGAAAVSRSWSAVGAPGAIAADPASSGSAEVPAREQGGSGRVVHPAAKAFGMRAVGEDMAELRERLESLAGPGHGDDFLRGGADRLAASMTREGRASHDSTMPAMVPSDPAAAGLNRLGSSAFPRVRSRSAANLEAAFHRDIARPGVSRVGEAYERASSFALAYPVAGIGLSVGAALAVLSFVGLGLPTLPVVGYILALLPVAGMMAGGGARPPSIPEPSGPSAQEVLWAKGHIDAILEEVGKVVVGQRAQEEGGPLQMLDGIVVGLVADGHVLMEGPPGIAKTTMAKALALAVGGEFRRLQFTADMLPSEVTGLEMMEQNAEGRWEARLLPGPVFTGFFLLADEINRAPPKTQSALLEPMAERTVSIGKATYPLSRHFFALATQNPLDRNGTYPLPANQLDRFLLRIRGDYPGGEELLDIMERSERQDKPGVNQNDALEAILRPASSLEQVARLREIARRVVLPRDLKGYIRDLVMATHEPEKHGLDFKREDIQAPLSPRASIALMKAAKAHALMAGRAYVETQDVKAVAVMTLAHRLDVKKGHSEDYIRKMLASVRPPAEASR